MSTKKKAVNSAKSSVEYNPFQIVNNVELKGNRTINPLTEKLYLKLIELEPRNRKQSVFIPLSVAKTRNEALNLILAAKRLALSKWDKYSFSSKYYFEGDVATGKYIGANVWRNN